MLLRVLLALSLTLPASAEPPDPCVDLDLRPGRCSIPIGWICLSPQFAAADTADREALVAKCKAEKGALRAEAETVLRREVGKVEAEKDALSKKLDVALQAGREAEEARDRAQEEAGSKFSTWEVVGLVAGGLAVGAAAGALVYWSATR